MTYRYTYKITLLKSTLANHYYYGRHKTDNINDGYCGSGVIIKNYFKKYGAIEGVTYEKEIVAFYNNEDELNKAEKELIGDKYDTDQLCLNLCVGGTWGELSEESCKKISDALKGRVFSDDTIEKMKKAAKQRFIDHPELLDVARSNGLKNISNLIEYTRSDENRERVRQMNYKRFEDPKERAKVAMSNSTRTTSEESKEKNRQSQLKRYETYVFSDETRRKLGDSSRDTFWIHLKNKCKRVSAEYLAYWLDDGWMFGRGSLKNANPK